MASSMFWYLDAGTARIKRCDMILAGSADAQSLWLHVCLVELMCTVVTASRIVAEDFLKSYKVKVQYIIAVLI